MANTLIKDALVVTMDESRPPFFQGDVLISGSVVKQIVAHPERVEPGPKDIVIDAGRMLVMPGFVNTHGHATMSLFRGYADDMPLRQWLEEIIWPVEANLRADDVYWGSLLSIAEMIRGGTTTFTDMYFFEHMVAEAAAQVGIRAVLSEGLLDLGLDYDQEIAKTESFIKNWHGAAEGRITVMIGPHSINTVPPPYMEKVMDLAARSGLPLQIHLAESRGEVEESLARHGVSPVKYLASCGLFSFPVLAAHCVHLSEEDITLLAEHRVAVSHNPGSNYKLGNGSAPVARLLEAGIPVGIGTDGPASNNNLDMIEEMRLTALLPKGSGSDPTLVEAGTALKMATAIGATTLGLKNTGILREGWKADLIGLQLDQPHLTPLHNPLSQLVYAAAAADVQLSMVDGRVLLEKGEFKTIDQEKIRAEATRCALRLTGGGR